MEIERKFLLEQSIDLSKFESKKIEQFYISFNPEVRIRKISNDCFLTIKSDGDLEREEIELTIAKEEYKKLKTLASTSSIKKTRYYISNGDFIYELDVYHNGLEGLFTVEVEFSSKKESKKFIAPNWFGKEITDVKKYKNKNLAKYGIGDKGSQLC